MSAQDRATQQEAVTNIDEATRLRILQCWERVYGRLVWHAYRALGNIEDAHDVVQEIGARLCRVLPKGDTDAGWQAQFFLWVRNEARSRLRARNVRAFFFRALSLDEANPEGRDDSPQQRAIDAESRQQLTRALKEMPRHLREAVVSYYYDGETYERLAGRLGCSIATASRRVHGGLNWLRDWFARSGRPRSR
jgi:RNA polymerase sigma factor (sigma-70 family)